MTDDEQREINRQNATRSTGPRTEAGKARSRRNALKHGLTGSATVLPPEDVELFKDRLHGWTCEIRPEGQFESYFLASAVLATVRLDRCARNEDAAVAGLRREAIRNWNRNERRRARRAGAKLEAEPAQAVAKLKEFAMGCDWLMVRWQELAAALDQPGFWTAEQAGLALRLLGKRPCCPHEGDALVAQIRLDVLGASPEVDPDDVDAFFQVSTESLDPEARAAACEARLPDQADARQRLQEVVRGELTHLQARRDELWYNVDGPDLAEEIDTACFDSSHQGTLRLRYESAHTSSLHRALQKIDRRRRAAGKEPVTTAAPQSISPRAWSPPPEPAWSAPAQAVEPAPPAVVEPAAPAPLPNEPGAPQSTREEPLPSVEPPIGATPEPPVTEPGPTEVPPGPEPSAQGDEGPPPERSP